MKISFSGFEIYKNKLLKISRAVDRIEMKMDQTIK